MAIALWQCHDVQNTLHFKVEPREAHVPTWATPLTYLPTQICTYVCVHVYIYVCVFLYNIYH